MIPAWYDIALREVGVHETPGPKATPRILEYLRETPLAQGGDSDETPWCSSFLNWCLRQVHIQGTGSAAARSWVTWGEAREPRLGAIVVLRTLAPSTVTSSGYHVGFYAGQTDRAIRLLGGNQGNAVSIAAFPYKRWSVVAVRWPVEVGR